MTVSSSRPVPRALLVLALIIVVAGVVMLVVGATQVGMTADEPFHLQRYAHWVQGGWYVADFQSDGSSPLPGVTDQYVYGPATMWLLHLLCLAVGVDRGSALSTSAVAYVVRHLGMAIIGLVGAAAVALIARLVLRSWSWALVAAAVLFALPMWTGNSMVNIKDPAVGTGYTLVTLGLVVIVREHPGRWRNRLWGPLALGAGTWLAMGTRPGMWSGVAAGVVITLVGSRLRRRDEGGGWAWWRLGEIVAGVVVAYVGLLALYPNVFLHPLAMAAKSASSSADFLMDGSSATVLTIPIHVLFLMPLGVLGLAVIGSLGTLREMLRSRLRLSVPTLRVVIVGVQMLAVPVVAMIHASNVSSDLRQLLFAVPATALIATMGLRNVLGWAAGERGPVTRGAAAIGCLVLALPTAGQLSLFPYGYASFNVLANLAGAVDNMPKDHYEISPRALAGAMPAGSKVVCNPYVDEVGDLEPIASLDGTDDCRWAQTGVVAPWFHGTPTTWSDPSTFWAVTVWHATPSNCTQQVSTTRRFLWQRITLSTLWKCQRVYPTLGGTALLPTDSAASGLFADGWYSPALAQPTGAAIAFIPATTLRGRASSLVIALSAPSNAVVAVDGDPVFVTTTATGLTVPLGSGTTQGRPVTVAFSAPPGQALTLQPASFRLAPQ